MGWPSTFADIEDRQFENGALIPGLADGRMMNYPLDCAMTWHDPPQLSAPARRLFERLVWLAPKDPVPNFLIEVRVPGIADEDIEERLTTSRAILGCCAVRGTRNSVFIVQ